MSARPPVTRPVLVGHLVGQRVGVTARDRNQAIAVAQEKSWWPRVLPESRTRPVAEHGKFWFVLADAPISGLEEFARTATTVRDPEED